MRKTKFKKFLAITMAAMVTLSTNAFATPINLDDSTANASQTDTLDKTNGTDHFADETTNVWQNGEISEEVRVTVDRASRFNITIPKEIVLNGNDGSANYSVSANGEIAGDQVISVVPDATFVLNEDGGKQVDVTVTQPDTDFTYAELDISKEYDGDLSAPKISAGNWSGSFYFNIEFKEGSSSSPIIYTGDPIILYDYGGGAIGFGSSFDIGWKCPGCGEEKAYPFKNKADACTDYNENHLPVCSKYDPVKNWFI